MQDYRRQISSANPPNAHNVFHVIEPSEGRKPERLRRKEAQQSEELTEWKLNKHLFHGRKA